MEPQSTRLPLPDRYDRAALAQMAERMHADNFNCAQSVACALGSAFGIDEDLCFRLAEGLGGGLGSHTETCGALLGGAMAMGLGRSNGPTNPTSKLATYQLSIKLGERFRERYGTTVCQEIRAQDHSGANPLPICRQCILDALEASIDVLEELAQEERGK